jgi:hypothetical protein
MGRDDEHRGIAGLTDVRRELGGQPDRDLPDPRSVPADLAVLVAEARVGCTTAMLMCLDRRQRLTVTPNRHDRNCHFGVTCSRRTH